jgi:hypothetical protein
LDPDARFLVRDSPVTQLVVQLLTQPVSCTSLWGVMM